MIRTALACAVLALMVLSLGAMNMDWSEGVAMTRSTLADETGVFGYSRQTLVLSRAKAEA